MTVGYGREIRMGGLPSRNGHKHVRSAVVPIPGRRVCLGRFRHCRRARSGTLGVKFQDLHVDMTHIKRIRAAIPHQVGNLSCLSRFRTSAGLGEKARRARKSIRRCSHGSARSIEGMRGVRLFLVPQPGRRERLLQGARPDCGSIPRRRAGNGAGGRPAMWWPAFGRWVRQWGVGNERCPATADGVGRRAGTGLDVAYEREERWGKASAAPKTAPAASEPEISLAFYRRHTGSLLRRYLYASMQVGRAPAVLSDPVGRGWASSRPVRSFEDALIFVLDVERCLNRLEPMDRQLVSRIVLQEYTQMETAAMLGMCVRTVSSRLARAMDRLTEQPRLRACWSFRTNHYRAQAAGGQACSPAVLR